jgi:undecaprenyl-diphosphatase
LGVLIRTPLARRYLAAGPLRQAWEGLLNLTRQPWRMTKLFASSAAVTGGYTAALAASMHACGAHVAFGDVAAVYLAGSALAAVSPTPGGLGALEAALVTGLTHFGGRPGPVVAGVLTFRLLTYWLPAIPGFFAFRHLRRSRVL